MARLLADDASEQDQIDCRHWREQDPRHEQARHKPQQVGHAHEPEQQTCHEPEQAHVAKGFQDPVHFRLSSPTPAGFRMPLRIPPPTLYNVRTDFKSGPRG
ncbi:MAG: FecR/PupR family sigma factor regulator, partial [Marinobacter sp.]